MLVPLDRHPGFPAEAKKKYPKHLLLARGEKFRMSEKGFYMWQIERSTRKLSLFLFLGICIVIMFMLF